MLVKRFVPLLGSLHLSLTAALGIWLWSDLLSFGTGVQKISEYGAANACAVGNVVVSVLGQDVPFHSVVLRGFSLRLHALFLIPGINLIIPMALYFGAYILLSRSTEPARLGHEYDSGRWHHLMRCLVMPSRKLQVIINPARKRELLPAFIGFGFLLAINLISIIDIELTLHRNRALQDPDQDEVDWGFGQILAVLLLLLALRGLAEAILACRLKQGQEELNEDLQQAIEKQDFDVLKRATERGSAFPIPKSPDTHFIARNVISAGGSLPSRPYLDVQSFSGLRA